MIINTQEIGERVHQLRTYRHMTLSALSAYFGVSMDYLIFGEDCDSFQLRADLLKVISELTEIVRKI